MSTHNGYIIVLSKEGSTPPCPSLLECVLFIPFPSFPSSATAGQRLSKKTCKKSWRLPLPFLALCLANEGHWNLQKMEHSNLDFVDMVRWGLWGSTMQWACSYALLLYLPDKLAFFLPYALSVCSLFLPMESLTIQLPKLCALELPLLLVRMLLKYYSHTVIRICLNGTAVLAVEMEREGQVQKRN